MTREQPPPHSDASSALAAHALAVEQVIATLGTSADTGLSDDVARQRLEEHGPNELPQAPAESAWMRLARQFKDLLIWILIAAAIISGLLGEWIDAGAIMAIVFLNGILGFIQESRAERALMALQHLASPQARVIRGGMLQDLPASQLVPGDRIELEPGDRIPADARLIHSAGLRVEEAALTGESVPVDKNHQPILPPDAPLGDRINMVYSGTAVTAGTGSAVVVATGINTQIGQIAGMLQQHRPEPTPLQKRLAELGRMLMIVVLAVVGIMLVMQVMRGGPLVEAFLLSVSLAVAAVPEGLSAVVTVALALGLQRMARRNALIRHLPSVETLGAVTVICSDKTGTLTRNQMTVRRVYAGGRWYGVRGAGYEPVGDFIRAPSADPSDDAAEESPLDPTESPDLQHALRIAAWCSHAHVHHDPQTDQWTLVGDPTEGALVVAAMKAGLEPPDREHNIVHEIPFSSDRKAMSVVAREQDGSLMMYTKGAPEVVLGKCTHERIDGEVRPLSDDRRREILDASQAMAEAALRVLALAYRPVNAECQEESDLIFAALAGMIDPPRAEARVEADRCQQAGIRPVMITGDHPHTARAIARRLNILREGDHVVTPAELDQMDDDELTKQIETIPVYARVTAGHKMRIIDAWRRRGHVVAMTGDGINDAPAIKAADVGIAMGITGTDVTREAADMVLTDDNFASIVNAVEEGRTIYDNIRKFVHYLLATNAGEVMLMFGAILAGWPAPLTAIQILWINLVTDALPAMALGIEPSEPDVMRRPPRRPDERIITLRRGLMILLHGALNATVGAIAFWGVYRGEASNLPEARTVAFTTMALAQLFFSLGCRSFRYTLPQLGMRSNLWLAGAVTVSVMLQLGVVTLPFAQPIFQTVPIRFTWEWGLILLMALLPVTLVEVAKLIRHAGWTRSAG